MGDDVLFNNDLINQQAVQIGKLNDMLRVEDDLSKKLTKDDIFITILLISD